jgi:hypothetical protein
MQPANAELRKPKIEAQFVSFNFTNAMIWGVGSTAELISTPMSGYARIDVYDLVRGSRGRAKPDLQAERNGQAGLRRNIGAPILRQRHRIDP